MARVQVQDLNEKLELADIDFLHIKDGASGIDYKFTFSNFELPTTNPTRQTVSNLGSVAFDNLVPLVRGGTGSSTAAGARTNLGLGTAATKDVGTSLGQIPVSGEDTNFRDITGRNIDATGYVRGSDPSLKSRKQVVSDITREDLDSIALYYFRWKDMEEVGESIRGTEDIGVMADEVQRVFPECVTRRSNGTLAVDYAKFATCFTLADYKLRREGK